MLISSLREYLRADSVNVTYENLQGKHDRSGHYLIVQKRYVGEDRPLETVRLDLRTYLRRPGGPVLSSPYARR